MLKIKDNVDLKELEKFGFEQIGKPIFKDYFKNLENNVFLAITNGKISKGKICAYQGNIKTAFDLWNGFKQIELQENFIQDLIQAGLVEKKE